MADLKIKVTAETDKAAKAIISFVASVERETDSATGAFTQLDAAIQKVGKDAAKSLPASIGPLKQAKISADQLKNSLLLVGGAEISATKSFKNLSTSAKGTTTTLINFGRVVQDAPFGIIGIANNIDPLVSSFQSLKKETGSTGGALKALAGGLVGPAGIAIAVSAVTSALIAFGPQIKEFIFGVKEASEETKKLVEGTSKELVASAKLISFAGDITKSITERKGALEELNNEYPNLLSNLDKENILLGNVKGAYDKVIDSILKRATIKGLELEIEKEVAASAEKILAIQRKQIEGEQRFVAEQEKKARAATFVKNAFDEVRDGTLKAGRAVSDFNAGLSNSGLIVKNLEGSSPVSLIAGIREELIKSIAPLLKLTDSYSDFGISIDENKDKTVQAKDAQSSLNSAWDAAIGKQVELKTALSGVVGEYSDLVAVAKLADAAFAAKPAQDAANKFKSISGAGNAPNVSGRKSTVQMVGDVEKARNAAVKLAFDTEAAVKSINEAVASLAVDALVGFAQAFGKAIVSGDIAGGIRQFAGVLGQAVTSLGVQVVAVSKTMVALKAALSSGVFAGPLGIVAGLGLIVAGAALSALANSGPKLARGGITTGPTRALIGEGGPEAVIPLSQLARLIGGGGGSQDVNVNGRLSGNLIYLSNQRGGASFSRLFG